MPNSKSNNSSFRLRDTAPLKLSRYPKTIGRKGLKLKPPILPIDLMFEGQPVDLIIDSRLLFEMEQRNINVRGPKSPRLKRKSFCSVNSNKWIINDQFREENENALKTVGKALLECSEIKEIIKERKTSVTENKKLFWGLITLVGIGAVVTFTEPTVKKIVLPKLDGVPIPIPKLGGDRFEITFELEAEEETVTGFLIQLTLRK